MCALHRLLLLDYFPSEQKKDSLSVLSVCKSRQTYVGGYCDLLLDQSMFSSKMVRMY